MKCYRTWIIIKMTLPYAEAKGPVPIKMGDESIITKYPSIKRNI